jgi:ABC-type transporter Mla MlaB component
MLRITIHDAPRTMTFRLEGRLASPWVRELEECWRGVLAGQLKHVLRVDLTEVTSIDAAGRACLEALHRQGAEFIAANCLMKALVAEITGAPEPTLPPRAVRSPSLNPKCAGQSLP